jgi:hypothetical protein
LDVEKEIGGMDRVRLGDELLRTGGLSAKLSQGPWMEELVCGPAPRVPLKSRDNDNAGAAGRRKKSRERS